MFSYAKGVGKKYYSVLQVSLEKLFPSYKQVYFQLIVLDHIHVYGQILHVLVISGGYLSQKGHI